MIFKKSYTPEDKDDLLADLTNQINAKIDPMNAALQQFWQIAKDERVWLFNSTPITYPFFITYDYPEYPYGYFTSNRFNGDVRFSPFGPQLKVDADGNLRSFFYKTNLPNNAQYFDKAVSAFRGNGGVFVKNQILADSGASQFWQKIFAVNGPYDNSFGKVPEIAGIKRDFATLKSIPVVDFGFRMYNKKGGMTYDTRAVTWNQVDFFEVPANGTISKHYPFCNGREMIAHQTFIDPPPADRRMVAHTISVGGGSIYISGGSVRAHITVLVR
jgi:hypothetical protein